MSKRPSIDWTATPTTAKAVRRKAKSVYTSIYQCKHDRGQGAPTGKYQIKYFCADFLKDPEAFSARVAKRLVIGRAQWKPEKHNGRYKMQAILLVDVYFKKNLAIVNQIVQEEILAEQVVEQITIDEPNFRGPEDEPPAEITLTLGDGVQEGDRLVSLFLKGQTQALDEKLVVLGAEYDIDLDAMVIALSQEVTKEFVIENLQNMADLTGYTLNVVGHALSARPIQPPGSDNKVPCAILSLSDLIQEEEDLREDCKRRALKANTYAALQTELDACIEACETATGKRVIPVMRVLLEFAHMGATGEELKEELRELISVGSNHWIEWCANSDWLAK